MRSAAFSANRASPRISSAGAIAVRDDVLERHALRIGGIVPFTTTDFPGRLAAVLFVQGCPWRCGYCHNPHLIPAVADTGLREHTWAGVLRWLESRRGLLDGVVFSGGEPTAQRAIVEAIRDVRALGFQVGLHTAGMYPRRLAALLPDLDWVGLDIKAPRAGYAIVTGIASSGVAAFEALEILRASAVEHELRTTVHPALTPPTVLTMLARELAARGVTRWTLQPFRPTGCEDETVVAAAPRGMAVDAPLLAALSAHIPEIVVR